MTLSPKYGSSGTSVSLRSRLIFSGKVMAQEPSNLLWTIDGNIRYRFEQWNNMNARFYGSEPAMGNPNESILLQRIIAGATVRMKDMIPG